MHCNSISSHQFRTWANIELSFWIHGEISTVNGEHFIADIITISSTTKFACHDKKNYSNEEKLTLDELVEKYKKEYGEEVKLNERKLSKKREHLCCLFIGCIFKFINFSTPLLFQPPPRLLIFGKFSNPTPVPPPPPSISDQRVQTGIFQNRACFLRALK